MGTVKVDWPTEGVMRLTMNQPAKKNAMSRDMREGLHAQFRSAIDNPLVRALILTGAGGTFSAGGDLDGIARVSPAEFRAYLSGGHDLVRTVYACPKPLVAAIEGVGVGGGVALALCADVIVMADSARMGLPFLKVGFVPDWGTLHTLPRRVGWATAQRLFLEARLIDAGEAASIGLCDAVAPAAELQNVAVARAVHLALQAPAALAATKRILGQLAGSLEEALARELDAQDEAFRGAEFAEGLAAFREKRPPRF
jgi:2-(1,2-epoxy-1,2-dihydrophenyl)acetyl-CoA isomerase